MYGWATYAATRTVEPMWNTIRLMPSSGSGGNHKLAMYKGFAKRLVDISGDNWCYLLIWNWQWLIAFSALMLLVGRQKERRACKKIEWCGAGVVICLERGANDLHMVQLMPLPSHHLLLHWNPDWFVCLSVMLIYAVSQKKFPPFSCL